MTKKEWDAKCGDAIEKEDQALSQLFLVLAHEYAHPGCEEDLDRRFDATFAVVEAWHEKMECFDTEPKLSLVPPILKEVK